MKTLYLMNSVILTLFIVHTYAYPIYWDDIYTKSIGQICGQHNWVKVYATNFSVGANATISCVTCISERMQILITSNTNHSKWCTIEDFKANKIEKHGDMYHYILYYTTTPDTLYVRCIAENFIMSAPYPIDGPKMREINVSAWRLNVPDYTYPIRNIYYRFAINWYFPCDYEIWAVSIVGFLRIWQIRGADLQCGNSTVILEETHDIYTFYITIKVAKYLTEEYSFRGYAYTQEFNKNIKPLIKEAQYVGLPMSHSEL